MKGFINGIIALRKFKFSTNVSCGFGAKPKDSDLSVIGVCALTKHLRKAFLKIRKDAALMANHLKNFSPTQKLKATPYQLFFQNSSQQDRDTNILLNTTIYSKIWMFSHNMYPV